MRLKTCAALAAVSSLAFASPATADIDTTGTDVGSIQAFGAPFTGTYGQTFTAGAGATSLSTFSLYLRERFTGSGTLDLRGYIATWDGLKAGSLLYSSATMTMNSAGTLQEFAFAPGIAVTPGAEYVAFLSIADLAAQPENRFRMPNSGDSIPGLFVFRGQGTSFASLFTNSWDQGFIGPSDVWFKADFGGVPEPATWAMMIGGFGLVGAAIRRRAKHSHRAIV